jgi:tape measure domain-containing protein
MGSTQIEEIILKVSIDDSRAHTQMKRLGNETAKTSKKTAGLTSNFKKIGGVIAALGLTKLAQGAFQVSLQYDKINQSLKTVTGSQMRANAEFKFLNTLADDLGVSVPSIAEGYTKLFASMKGAGIATSVTRELTTGMAELSTAMSLTASDTGGINRALSQIAAKGKVSSEELQQLAERGVDAFGLASRAIGVSTKELSKMLEQGKIISSDFLPKFGAQLRKEFGGAAKDAATSAQANINRLSNEWNRALSEMGTATHKFIPVLTSLVKGFNNTTEAVQETASGFNLWIDELLGIEDGSGRANRAAIELGRTRKLQAEEMKKNAKIIADEKAELDKLNATMKKLSSLNQLGAGFINASSLEEMRDNLKLTKSEFEALRPAILDALSKNVDMSTLSEQVKRFVVAFKEELNTIQKSPAEALKGPLDGLINSGLKLKNALNMKKELGLSQKEFEKIGVNALDQASSSKLSTEQLKKQVNLLREMGVLTEDDKKREVTLPELKGTAFEAGSSAATEFLKQSELDVTRNDMLNKIVRNTEKSSKSNIIVKR